MASYPKRLIEVDLPIKRISAHARRESPYPEDPETAVDVRFIEVKGRAGVGEVALTQNEYRTAERMKQDYWLYVVYNCASTPTLHTIQDPTRLGWQPVVQVEHYKLAAEALLAVTGD